MLDRLPGTAPHAGADTLEGDVAALVSVAEESSDQVRLMNGIDRAPMSLRAVRENAIVVVGSLFLPRGCAIEVDFRSEVGFGDDGDGPLHVLHVAGVVQKVTLLDPSAAVVLVVHVTEDRSGCLGRLRAALGG